MSSLLKPSVSFPPLITQFFLPTEVSFTIENQDGSQRSDQRDNNLLPFSKKIYNSGFLAKAALHLAPDMTKKLQDNYDESESWRMPSHFNDSIFPRLWLMKHIFEFIQDLTKLYRESWKWCLFVCLFVFNFYKKILTFLDFLHSDMLLDSRRDFNLYPASILLEFTALDQGIQFDKIRLSYWPNQSRCFWVLRAGCGCVQLWIV